MGRLSALFSFAVSKKWITSNPCDDVQKLAWDKERPRIMAAEVEKLLTMCRAVEPSLLGYLAVGIFTGIRPGALECLLRSGVDLEEAHIVVSAAAKKTRKRRVVPLNKDFTG